MHPHPTKLQTSSAASGPPYPRWRKPGRVAGKGRDHGACFCPFFLMLLLGTASLGNIHQLLGFLQEQLALRGALFVSPPVPLLHVFDLTLPVRERAFRLCQGWDNACHDCRKPTAAAEGTGYGRARAQQVQNNTSSESLLGYTAQERWCPHFWSSSLPWTRPLLSRSHVNFEHPLRHTASSSTLHLSSTLREKLFHLF